jgi:hypothetical protein
MHAHSRTDILQAQILKNLTAVLKAAGSSVDNIVKLNIFLTSMDDFAAMNRAYDRIFFKDPKPICVSFISFRNFPPTYGHLLQWLIKKVSHLRSCSSVAVWSGCGNGVYSVHVREL